MKEKKIEDIDNLMKSKNLKEKIRIIEELAKDDSPKSIQHLISFLSSPSWSIREKVSEVLGTKGEKILDKLFNLLEEGVWYTRATVAKTMGNIGSLNAITILLKHCEDSNLVVKQNVVEALKKIVEKNGLDTIEASLNKEEIDKLKNILNI